jgi:hypothetical protein
MGFMGASRIRFVSRNTISSFVRDYSGTIPKCRLTAFDDVKILGRVSEKGVIHLVPPSGSHSVILMLIRLSPRRRFPALAAFLAFGLAACGNLPDVTLFAGATESLRDAVVQVAPAVTAEVQKVPNGVDYVTDIRNAWKVRIDAVNAMNNYSQSLVAIVGAGDEGSKTAESIGNSFGAMLTQAGNVLPGVLSGVAPIAENATEAVKLLVKTYVNIKAMSDLEDALDATQPGINTFSKLLSQDLAELDELVLDAQAAVELERTLAYNDKYAALKGLEVERTKLHTVYARAIAENTKHLEAMVEIIINDTGGELKEPPFSKARLGELSDAIAEVDKLIKANDFWVVPLKAEVKREQERVTAARQLIASTQIGVRQWAVAHANLVAAVQEGRTPNFHNLIKTAAEIEDLVTRFRTKSVKSND